MYRSVLILLLVVIASSSVTAGELTNQGPDGVLFHDAATGLYWIDPIVFSESARATTDAFASGVPSWSYATSTQIQALVGSAVTGGLTLEDVMGTRLSTATGPRWTGFCEGTIPDGWLLEATISPYDAITIQSSQANTAAFPHGAWMTCAVDPLALARLDPLDSAEYPYFQDTATGLYWWDPGVFTGMSRAEIDTWLLANTDWRWASAAEIMALQGKFTENDVPLTSVLGPATATVGSGISRWLGYYEQTDQPDGILLQTGSIAELPFITVYSTQSNAESFNPGAWLVSDDEPTPVQNMSLGAVKAMYRN